MVNWKIFPAIVLSTIIATIIANRMGFTPFKNGKLNPIIIFDKKNFMDWGNGFETGISMHEMVGIKALSVCFSIENEN